MVQDTGTGIPAGELEHIFDRFATGPKAASGHRGTGLGLALVRAVAEGHGGRIGAQSTPGLGSRFEFILPVAATAAAAPRPLVLPVQADDPGNPCRSGLC